MCLELGYRESKHVTAPVLDYKKVRKGKSKASSYR